MHIDLNITIDQAHLLYGIVLQDRDRYLGALPAHLRMEFALVPLHQALLNQVAAKVLEAYEVTFLRALSEHRRPMSQKQLALGYAPSKWIDGAFANLLERGWVVVSDQQGSKGCFQITEKGKAALKDPPPIAMAKES
jgi:hypothetical protein